MNNRNLLIGFLNYCQNRRKMPTIDDDNTYLVDDYLRQQNLQQCNVSNALPIFEQFVDDDEKANGKQTEFIEDSVGGSEKYFSWSVIERWFRRQ